MNTQPATVLVVESNDGIRRLIAVLLACAGYSVLEASTAEAAVALLQEQLEINLLLADVVVPGEMDCVDLAERAKALRPGLRMLFTAGLARQIRELASDGHQSLAEALQDPERVASLLAVIQAALAST